MRAFEIPVSAQAQVFSLILNNTNYTFSLHWCVASNCWVLDISDADDVPLVGGIAVVTGCDLLFPYRYLGFVGSLVAMTEGDYDTPPTFANLGDEGKLYYVTP